MRLLLVSVHHPLKALGYLAGEKAGVLVGGPGELELHTPTQCRISDKTDGHLAI